LTAQSGARSLRLDDQTCWDLIATQPVGRIGICRPDGPVIIPVNHSLIHRTVVFRTRIDAAPLPENGERVAFEVDGINSSFREGWSVLVVGTASHIELPDTMTAAIDTWAGGDRRIVVAISPERVSGRHLVGAPLDWAQDIRGYL
jgi:nitroimidazol reductase NimA-like FMN-containing flavoprotein (pyridoxamine 5'-phosphate oxidase superfamily)